MNRPGMNQEGVAGSHPQIQEILNKQMSAGFGDKCVNKSYENIYTHILNNHNRYEGVTSPLTRLKL